MEEADSLSHPLFMIFFSCQRILEFLILSSVLFSQPSFFPFISSYTAVSIASFTLSPHLSFLPLLKLLT